MELDPKKCKSGSIRISYSFGWSYPWLHRNKLPSVDHIRWSFHHVDLCELASKFLFINCVGKHPRAKIIQNFYHNRKVNRTSVPRVLNLTASSVMKSDPKSVSKVKETLAAICRTLKKHRAGLRLQVKLPVLSQLFYISLLSSSTKAMGNLGSAHGSLSIAHDPYVLALEKEYTERA